MTANGNIQVTPRVLERLKVGDARYVHGNMKFDAQIADMTRDELVVSVTAYVLADHLVHDPQHVQFRFQFPSSPWQHFKQNHAYAWWLRWLVTRRPVRTTEHYQAKTVTFDRYATYPNADAPLDPSRFGHRYFLEKVDVEDQ